MITIKNEQFKEAVANRPEKPSRLAIKAEGSPQVLDKLLNQKTDFTLTAADKIVDYLGFDIVVELIPRKSA